MFLNSLKIYRDKNILKIGLYGFICGMNLLLSGNTINYWLASSNIDTKTIGLFSFVILPYVLKFLVSIFINHNKIYFLSSKIGNHKSWLIFAQIGLIFCLFFTSFLVPEQNLFLIALIGFLIALFAVIEDVILNSNRIRILDHLLQPLGTAIYNVGYRLGMLFSGAGVIFASIYLAWSHIYIILSLIYSIFAIVLLVIYKEIENTQIEEKSNYNNWRDIFIVPFQDFMTPKNFIWMILFILIYKLPDNMLVIMLNPFLLQTGYSAAEIASISKFFGVIMAIIGGIISGPIIIKFGIRNSLIGLSIMHIFGHILFIILVKIGKNIEFLYLITAYETLIGGAMMTAYFSLISNLCKKGEHTATRYALLSSGIGLSKMIFPASSGLIASYYGWTWFFIFITILSIFTTLFTYFVPKKLFKI